MSQRTRTTFEATYNNTTSGAFPTNTTQQIGSDDMRAQSKDISDSTFFLLDDKYTGAGGVKPGVTSIATLKGITTATLAVGVHVVFRDTGNGNVLRVYELVSGTDAESSPTVIRPNDYAASTNEKVWKLCRNSINGGTP